MSLLCVSDTKTSEILRQIWCLNIKGKYRLPLISRWWWLADIQPACWSQNVHTFQGMVRWSVNKHPTPWSDWAGADCLHKPEGPSLTPHIRNEPISKQVCEHLWNRQVQLISTARSVHTFYIHTFCSIQHSSGCDIFHPSNIDIFLISPWKHMLWVHIRSTSLRCFLWVLTTYVFMEK